MPKRILTESLFYSLRLRWERFKLAFSEERLRRQGVEMDVFVADNGAHFVLEVNTSPSCSPLTGAAYCEAFKRMLGLDTPLDLGALDVLNPPPGAFTGLYSGVESETGLPKGSQHDCRIR